MLWIASANRDEDVFVQPDSFVVGREESHHLAFGTGIHYCIGAKIARMEVQVMLSELQQLNRSRRAAHLSPNGNSTTLPI